MYSFIVLFKLGKHNLCYLFFHPNFNMLQQVYYILTRIIMNAFVWSSSCKPNDSYASDSKQNQNSWY